MDRATTSSDGPDGHEFIGRLGARGLTRRPGAGRLAVLALAWGVSPLAGQARFTVEEILTAPFASDLVASPVGNAFAWVRYERGARNIWVAEAPGYAGRQITRWASDDGQDVLDLSFTPDGTGIVFVRGGGPNRQGEIPNPTSEPEPAERAIWIASLDGADARRLAEGSDPEISPDGRVIAFSSRGQIHTVRLDDAEAEAGPLLRVRGSAGSIAWSPSGDQIAFVSNRGDHAFIGVFDLASRSVRYLDPSLDRDGAPIWSPDGTRIAFLRIPNEGQRLPFEPVRDGLPWSIRVADAETGAGRAIWQADEGPGSAFRPVSGPQLVWTANDALVFPWERDGWTHLYSIAVSGGAPRLLTPGEFEVEDVRRAPGGGAVYYTSNQDDVDRRHVWRVRPDGSAAELLTPGRGIEWSPAIAPDGETFAFLASSAREPAHAEVTTPGTTRRAMVSGYMPTSFPLNDLVEPEQAVFQADDGVTVHAQLFLPPDLAPGETRPAAIFFHGGSRRQMLLGWHYLRYYHNTYALNQYLASRGYVVLSVNYRSGIGYGMEFREALDYGARGASEYRDVLAAGRFLAARADVDANRIGLWGGSYGGYLTALGLARNSNMFASGVDIHGVHDWNVVIRNFVPTYQAGARADFAKLAYESSPMSAIDGWRSPVLLIHGDDDRNVPFSESVDLIEALRRRDVVVEQLVFPDEVHGFLLHRNWLGAFEAAADFFDRTLFQATTTDAGR
ncbi:MAG: prolyl oligopeptidase family serine peptidase [Gemmatimonadota bacterium]|nr:prolyl oligopeptidase family serine peptidase [Gemmatimonadota bacterium]